ncbi:MAG TPA: hypothetical protein DHV28_00890 [Ignavibacteriales bacterium]|nr:hypothetical protein [Ignavibacteriales bacterium]
MDKSNKIVVVDLDNTLLNIDSFNKFLSDQTKNKVIRVILFRILRKLRLISLKKLKEWTSNYIYDNLPDEIKLSFINSLRNYINIQLYETIKNEYQNYCRIIIISASLDQYVKPFANHLGWEGYGSHMDKLNNKYVHLHGNNKLEFLTEQFPESKFSYVYAVSDSNSDKNLLKMFTTYDLINPVRNLI